MTCSSTTSCSRTNESAASRRDGAVEEASAVLRSLRILVAPAARRARVLDARGRGRGLWLGAGTSPPRPRSKSNVTPVKRSAGKELRDERNFGLNWPSPSTRRPSAAAPPRERSASPSSAAPRRRSSLGCATRRRRATRWQSRASKARVVRSGASLLGSLARSSTFIAATRRTRNEDTASLCRCARPRRARSGSRRRRGAWLRPFERPRASSSSR